MNMRYSVLAVAAVFLSIPLSGAQESKSSSTGKGYLGVQIQDVSRKIEKRFKVPSDEGAYITEVVKNSPAERAGLTEDDVVLSFAGKDVYDAEDLMRFVRRTLPETTVDVVVWRDAARKTIAVTVGKRKDLSSVFLSKVPGSDGPVLVWSGRTSYGLELTTLNEQLAAYFGVPGNEGVLVEFVKKDGPASKAGFQAGDVITTVGKQRVKEHADVIRELGDYEEGDKVEVEVYRKGSRKTLSLEVEEAEGGGHEFFFRDFGVDDNVLRVPQIRMKWLTEPGKHLQIDKFREEVLEDTHRDLQESLEDIREKAIHIRKAAPLLGKLGRSIVI